MEIDSFLLQLLQLSLPTLSPTSLPPLLSLLSLRSELGNLTKVWSLARSRIECLEFVKRRWGIDSVGSRSNLKSKISSSSSSGDEDSQRCPICFEPAFLFQSFSEETGSSSSLLDGGSLSADEAEVYLSSIPNRRIKKQNPNVARLDCGHLLHSKCLVDWLTKQAFCPTCHNKLKATPPSTTTTTNRTSGPITVREAMIRATGSDNF